MAITKDLLDLATSGSLDPETGLQGPPKTTSKSALTADELDVILKNPVPQTSLGAGSLGLDYTKFKNYGGMPVDTDLIEYRATNQSVGEQLAFGLGRLVGTTATKLLAGLGYTFSGVPALVQGDMGVMLDNEFSSLINEGEEWLKQEFLPIHHKRKYLEGNVFNQMGTFSFWMDDVVDGFAFMASAYVGAKGLDKIGSGVKGYTKLAQLTSRATKAAKLGKMGQASPALAKWAKFADYTTINLFNSFTEASFEAKEVKDNVLAELDSKVRRGEITQEQANAQASEAARNTYWWNVAALMPSNAITNSMLFKKFDNMLPSLGVTGRIGKDIKPLTRLQKAGVFGKDALMSMVSEGVYEENIQTAVSNYYANKAKAFDNPSFADEITGVFKEYINNFSTDEGQKSIMLGAIIGLLPGGLGGVHSASRENKRQIALQESMATFLDQYKSNAHAFYKTKKSLIAPDTDVYVLDENGKPVIDETKVRAGFAGFYDSYTDLVNSLKAVDSGNEIMFDFIRNVNFAKVVAGFYNREGGVEALDEWVDFQIEAEKEELAKAGHDVDPTFLTDMAEDYKKKARMYLNRLRQIDNNYAGIMSLPQEESAEAFRRMLKAEQYNTAVSQAYWTEVADNLKKDLKTARQERDTEAEQSINEQLKDINKVLEDSYAKMIDLLDPAKQLARYKAQQEEIDSVSDGKGAVDSETVEQASNVDKNEQDTATNTVGDKVIEETPHNVVGPDNTLTSSNKITKEQAETNGYIQDPVNESVYYKADKENGTLHTLTVDNEGNIVKDTYTDQRKLFSTETGAEKQVATNFVNGKLKSVKVKDITTGIVTQHTANTQDSINDIEEVFSKIKRQLNLTVDNPSAKRVSPSQPKLLDDIRAELRADMEEAREDLKSYISSLAKSTSAQLNKGYDRINKRNELEATLREADNLRKLYGDTRYEGTSLQQLFSDKSIKYVPAIFGKKVGIIENKNGEVLFREIDNQGKLVKEYYLGGIESITTLGELNIMVLKQVPFDLEIVADGRTYNIQGTYYNNLFENPTDAIEYTPEGEVEAITLWDSNNNKIRFTNLFLIQNIAYAIELVETIEQQVINDYIKDDNDFVVYSFNNKDYAVYKKVNGKYAIIDVDTGRQIKGRLFTTVKQEFLKGLQDTINQLVVSKINEINSSKKDIRDEIRKIATAIRPATPREAIKLPDQSETKDPEGREGQTGKQTSSEEIEKEITQAIAEQAAEIEAAEEIQEKQIEEAKQVEQEEEISQYSGEVEILAEEETPTEGLEEPDYGIRSSATAASYVWYNRETEEYVVNNAQFHIDAINAGETELYFTPVIDFNNTEFWPSHPELKEELQKGNISEARIEEILTVTEDTFNNPVDAIPIKLDADIESVYYHTTAYDKISVPERIKRITDKVERAKEYVKYVREQQMLTRHTRKQLLRRLLKGEVVTFNSSNKTLGAPNNTGENKNLGEVLKRVDNNIDLRTVTLGVGVRPGQIYKNKEDFIETVGTVGKGNIVLETNYTANGRTGLIKLNPSKLSREHANIVFNAFKQAYTKGSGGFTSKYEGSEVTGGLTRLEVLNLLIYYGEDNTKVDSKNVRTKGYLRNKQLWVENAKILHFGEQSINLHTSDKAEIQKFVDWAINSKNYAINRHLLGSQLKGKTKFSIGNFKYDSSIDNYTSFVIKNGLVLTDVDVVPGTKSLFKQPVIGIDLASGGIDSTPQKVTETFIKRHAGQRQQPLTKPAVEQPVVQTEPEKKEGNPTASEASYGKTLEPLTSTKGIETLPVGSIVYIPIKEGDVITKYSVGRIATSSTSGKTGFVMDLRLDHFMLKGIKSQLEATGSFAFDDVFKVERFRKIVAGHAEYIHFDSPAKPEITQTAVEPVTSEPLVEDPIVSAEELEDKTVQEQIDDPGIGDGYIDLPNTGDTNLDDIDGIYRTSESIEGIYTVADIKAEISALNKRLRANRWGEKIPVDIIDRLIKIGQNRHAFAQFRHDGFKLSRLAEEGSMYHEIFHRVSLGYLTESERQSLYSEVRNTVNKEYTDMQAEEFLAEKYREYALRKTEDITKEPKLSLGKKISNFIRNLFNFIYTWFTGNTRLDSYDIETVFKAIDAGRYKFARISKSNLNKIKGNAYNFEVKETVLTSIQSSKEYREVIQNLFFWLAESNALISIDPTTKETNVNISSFEDVGNIKFGPLYDKINALRNRYNSVAKNTDTVVKLLQENKLTAAQLTQVKRDYLGPNSANLSREQTLAELVKSSTISKRIANIYDEVYSKFDVFKEGLEDFLFGLNITQVRDNSDIELQEIDEETGENLSQFERYNKTSYAVSSKENTQLSIKILLSMLPESNERSNLTGMRKFAEFSKMWSTTVNDLMGSMNAEEMITRLQNLSTDNIPYQYLVKRLKSDENLKTQFYKTMQKYKHNFYNMLAEIREDGGMSYRMVSASIQQAAGRYVKDWGSSFVKNKNLFVFEKDKSPKGNIEIYEQLIDQYNDLFTRTRKQINSDGEIINLYSSLKELTSMLNTISIPVDENILRRAIAELNSPNESIGFLSLLKDKLNYLFADNSTIYKVLSGEKIVDSKGKAISPDKVFTKEKGVDFLANVFAKAAFNELGDSIYGPSGNRYYTIAQNTYISDLLREIKNDPVAFVNKRMSALYSQNSKWLEQLSQDPKLAEKLMLMTMSSFSREDMYDTGREYQALTSMEDILMRITAIESGKLTPPTPADRGFFYFYDGFDTLDVTLDNNGKLPEDVLDVFEGYYKDEVNRILKVRREVDLVLEGELDSSNLFETYHYKKYAGRDTKGEGIVDGKVLKEKGRYTGRGANFTHFSGFTTSMLSADVRTKIEEVINKRVDETIKLLAANNIVSIIEDSNGKITSIVNRLLDNKHIEKYEKLVGDEQLAIRSLITNFVVNTQYANIETGKVFTGDPASFKSSEDYVKRLPGYTSTGDNLRTDFPTDYFAGERLIHQPTYNVTTFSSHVIESTLYPELVNIHKQYYLDKGMAKTEAQALKMAETKLANLKKVDQTDAQTFISAEMYRAISIRLGEWNDNKENAYQILQSGDITREKAVELNNIVMHPLKMTYMDIIHRDGHMIPVFDKMSMSTLFRPMVKGTQLEELLDRMEAKGKYAGLAPIDHVKFHTAEKVGIKDRREIFADKTEKSLTDLTAIEIYPQNFDRLRKQLVTGHDVSKLMVGSQVKKIGMSNIFADEIYTVNGEEMFGEELRREINDIISELSNRGKDKLFQELKIDGTTVRFTDAKSLVDRLREEAKKAQLPDYIVEAFKLDENGKFYVSIDSFVGNRKWMQSRIISLIKKASIDLYMPGNAFIQMSDIGLRNAEFTDELRMMDEDGYIEAKVSINLFKNVIPGYENLTHSERIEYLTRSQEHLLLGYRVPTQGQNSVYMMKIVDFLPESIGDTIILPKEGTALGGFDFDIDKLYVVRHNYKNGKKVEYDKSKGIQGNSNEALENRLLDDYFGVLRNENHFIRRTTPLGYTAGIMQKLSEDIRSWKGIKEDVTDALSMVSPAYQIDVKERYKFGKEGLGPFALANVHHILGQMVKLGMLQNIGVGYTNETGNTDLSQILGQDGIDITEWFSGLIDAHVDIAADPYIYYLNVNEYTRDLVTLLIRAGFGGTRTFKFTAQPILEDIAKLRANRGNKLSVSTDNLTEQVRREYSARLFEKTDKVKRFDPSMLNDILSEGKLENLLTDGLKKKDADFYQNQLLILDAFEYINQFAGFLKEAILASRIDTKKFGSSYSEVLSYKNRVLKSYSDMYSGVGVLNFDKLMEDTYLNALTSNSIDVIESVMSNIVIEGTPAFTSLLDKILKVTGNLYSLDERMLPSLIDDIYTSIYASFFRQHAGLTQEVAKDMLYGDNSVPKVIHDIKTGVKYPHLKNNQFIRAMDPVYAEGQPDFISFSKPDNKWYRDDLSRAWKDIFAGDIADRDLAVRIFYYSFLTSGFKGTVNSFHDLAPLELIKYTGLDNHIKTVLRSAITDSSLMEPLFDGIFVNNWSNDSLVPRVNKVAQEVPFEGKPLAIKVNQTRLLRGTNISGQPVYSPFIKIGKGNPTLYKYVGYLQDSNQAVYVPVGKKGYRKAGQVVNESMYNGSIFDNNISPVAPKAARYTSVEGFVELLSQSTAAANIFTGFVPVYDLKLVQSKEDISNITKSGLSKVYNTETIQETTQVTASDIYSKLGNKTASGNVVITKWGDLKDVTEPFLRAYGIISHVVSTRVKNSNEHFGNPFSHDPAGKAQGLIKTETVKEAVEKYIDWVLNSMDSRAIWIREQLQSGALQGKPILYYTELGEPSHATALDYLINKYNWDQQSESTTTRTLTDEEVEQRIKDCK